MPWLILLVFMGISPGFKGNYKCLIATICPYPIFERKKVTEAKLLEVSPRVGDFIVEKNKFLNDARGRLAPLTISSYPSVLPYLHICR